MATFTMDSATLYVPTRIPPAKRTRRGRRRARARVVQRAFALENLRVMTADLDVDPYAPIAELPPITGLRMTLKGYDAQTLNMLRPIKFT